MYKTCKDHSNCPEDAAVGKAWPTLREVRQRLALQAKEQEARRQLALTAEEEWCGTRWGTWWDTARGQDPSRTAAVRTPSVLLH
jgi:hypothetical protein